MPQRMTDRSSLLLVFSILLILCCSPGGVSARGRRRGSSKTPQDVATVDGGSERKQRLFSLFNVVRFRNDACTTTNNALTGQCLPTNDCSNLGGSAAGNCAAGFGTCCLFQMNGCGGTVNRNCTYVRHTSTIMESCKYTVTKCAPDVCFTRLDFRTYMDAGPALNALNVPADTGDCMDQLTFMGGNGVPVADICGTLTGQHIYLESGLAGTPTMFTAVYGANGAMREYDIKISQIQCGKLWTPPTGCEQYFTGAGGQVSSFNHNGGMGFHLNDQEYSICIRQELGYCTIRYTPVGAMNMGFFFSNTNQNDAKIGSSEECKKDYVLIPKSSNGGANSCEFMTKIGGGLSLPIKARFINRYCGAFLNCIDGQAFNSPIVSETLPFQIHVKTNSMDTITTVQPGLRFDYQQLPC